MVKNDNYEQNTENSEIIIIIHKIMDYFFK